MHPRNSSDERIMRNAMSKLSITHAHLRKYVLLRQKIKQFFRDKKKIYSKFERLFDVKASAIRDHCAPNVSKFNKETTLRMICSHVIKEKCTRYTSFIAHRWESSFQSEVFFLLYHSVTQQNG